MEALEALAEINFPSRSHKILDFNKCNHDIASQLKQVYQEHFLISYNQAS